MVLAWSVIIHGIEELVELDLDERGPQPMHEVAARLSARKKECMISAQTIDGYLLDYKCPVRLAKMDKTRRPIPASVEICLSRT